MKLDPIVEPENNKMFAPEAASGGTEQNGTGDYSKEEEYEDDDDDIDFNLGSNTTAAAAPAPAAIAQQEAPSFHERKSGNPKEDG